MRRSLLAFLVLAAPALPQDYGPVDLDTFDATSFAVAFATSRTGDIAVGLAVPDGGGGQKASVWAGNGTIFLPNLAGDELGGAYGVNDAGRIVGESVNVTQQGDLTFFTSRGVLWVHGTPMLLADLAASGAIDIEPFVGVAINHREQILGWGKRKDVNGLRGFVLDHGVMADIGTLQGTLTSSALPSDMNEQGVVVGESEAANFFDHAFVWQDGVMTDLHVASGVIGRNSHAAAINEDGVVVGDADPVNDFLDYQNAALWVDGVLTYLPDLGDVGGVIESFARDVNDHGTIVGTSVTPTFEVHAVTWRDGQVVDLNTLIPPGGGWILANAHAISNDGRIFGEGFLAGGLAPFMLVPDCGGGFDVYAAGCPGSEDFTPGLWGQGCAESGGEISLALTNGVGGAAGLLLIGLDDQTATFKGCPLSVLPLSPLAVPLLLGGSTGVPGAGQLTLPATLPPAIPAVTLNLQAILVDAGGPQGFTVTHAVSMTLP